MADVSATLDAWSTTVGSNNPSGSTAIGTGLDDNLRQIQAVVRLLAASNSIASATTTDLSTVNETFLTVTGTTTITALGTLTAGMYKALVFAGALTFTHNATSLILPGGANITTAAGDVALMLSLGSGNWRCLFYTKASGQPLVGQSFGDGTVSAPSITFTSDTNAGWYRIGADNIGLTLNGAKVVDYATTGVAITGTLTASGAVDFAAGLNAGTSNAFSLASTGVPTWSMSGSGAATMYSGTNTFDIRGHTTGGGRLDMTSTGVSLYAGSNIPGYIIAAGTTGSWSFAKNSVGDGLRWNASNCALSVVETVGKPTVNSGGGATPSVAGTDQAFKVTLGAGPGVTLVIDFAGTWPNAPIVIPRYQSADINVRASSISTTSVTFTFASTPAVSGVLDVICIGTQAS